MAQRHPLQNTLAPFLRPLSLIYARIMHWRRVLYQQGLLKTEVCPRPCVCVGNISWGGTGKTPVVDWLSAWAEEHDLRAAVLTRGYGGKPPSLPWKVDPDDDPKHSGDEALMLARKHPHSSIWVDPNRNRAAGRAQNETDLFILDDGFQRLATGRDLNLVLLDKDDIADGPLSNWNRVLPAGTWREPYSALHDASAFLVKTAPEEWKTLLPALKQRLAPFPQPVFAFHLENMGIVPISTVVAMPPAAGGMGMQGKSPARESEGQAPQINAEESYALVTGVGNPAQVRRSAEAFLGRAPSRELFFPDHHDFSKDRDMLSQLDMPALCTAKDAVKLAKLGLPNFYILEVRARFYAHTGDLPFPTWLEKQMSTI